MNAFEPRKPDTVSFPSQRFANSAAKGSRSDPLSRRCLCDAEHTPPRTAFGTEINHPKVATDLDGPEREYQESTVTSPLLDLSSRSQEKSSRLHKLLAPLTGWQSVRHRRVKRHVRYADARASEPSALRRQCQAPPCQATHDTRPGRLTAYALSFYAARPAVLLRKIEPGLAPFPARIPSNHVQLRHREGNETPARK